MRRLHPYARALFGLIGLALAILLPAATLLAGEAPTTPPIYLPMIAGPKGESPPAPSGFTAISNGDYHTCAVAASGALYCWGANSFGQVGDGANAIRSTMVGVTGLSSGMKAVAARGDHTCALTGAGGVRCWGSNQFGELGNGLFGGTEMRNTPQDVVGLASGATAVSIGASHSCALMADGSIRCWGNNNSGQLGSGDDEIASATPVAVAGITNAKAIALGYHHSCALTSDGAVKCWGMNIYGALGNGTKVDSDTPVDVIGLQSGVKAITAGGFFTCAVTSTNGVECWGSNATGQQGDGTTEHRTTPGDVSGLTSGVAAVSAGGGHVCAVLMGGALKCWGSNSSGQIGDGTSGLSNGRPTPVAVIGLSSGVSSVSAGGFHTCVVMTSGGLKCWGRNEYGSLGDGSLAQRDAPVDVVVP